jgi:GNAT superfamily N-acetyltransferase
LNPDFSDMDRAQVTLRTIPAQQIELAKELWLELAEHHWSCAAEIAALATPVNAGASWAMRRAQYVSWASETGWLLLGAELDGRLIGYAAARITPGASSWNFGSSVGRLETLVVHSRARGRGVGELLLEAVQRHWRAAGIGYGSVSVIAGNSGAMRFYERHLEAVEFTRTCYFPL